MNCLEGPLARNHFRALYIRHCLDTKNSSSFLASGHLQPVAASSMPSQKVTPPVIQSAIPTAKERKYDRQLRLWAASGQQALEDAKIMLLNSNPGVVGVETLKNLVLPGVGSFTIVDGTIVSESDLGLNFFLEKNSVGKSRATETSKYLKELNPDVEFHSVEQVNQGCLLPHVSSQLICALVSCRLCQGR